MRPVQHIGNVVFFDTLFIVLVLRFESGDQMLQAVALAMQELFGRKHCYRIGGDEFVAVLRNRQDSSVENSAQMLEKILARRWDSVAVGAANARVEELDIDELFKLAEKRMYAAKEK